MVSVKRKQPRRRAVRAGIGEVKKIQTCGTISGTGSFQGGGNVEPSASEKKCLYILTKILLVEINCEKKAGLVFQHRVDADGKIMTSFIGTTKMLFDNVVRNRNPFSILAFRTFDFRLGTNSASPLVGTYRLITAFPGLHALKTSRKHILATTKQTAEYSDFLVRRILVGCSRWWAPRRNRSLPNKKQFMEFLFQFFLFSRKSLQPGANGCYSLFHVMRFHTVCHVTSINSIIGLVPLNSMSHVPPALNSVRIIQCIRLCGSIFPCGIIDSLQVKFHSTTILQSNMTKEIARRSYEVLQANSRLWD